MIRVRGYIEHPRLGARERKEPSMSKLRWGAALVAALLGTTSGSVSLAKPPDLPAGQDVRCPEGEGREEPAHSQFRFGWDVLRGQLRVEVETGGAAPAE